MIPFDRTDFANAVVAYANMHPGSNFADRAPQSWDLDMELARLESENDALLQELLEALDRLTRRQRERYERDREARGGPSP